MELPRNSKEGDRLKHAIMEFDESQVPEFVLSSSPATSLAVEALSLAHHPSLLQSLTPGHPSNTGAYH